MAPAIEILDITSEEDSIVFGVLDNYFNEIIIYGLMYGMFANAIYSLKRLDRHAMNRDLYMRLR